MVKDKLAFFILFVCSLSMAFAQRDYKISGFVLNNGDPISSVVITNINTKKNTISDSAGIYKIAAHDGDTLSFTHIGYQEEKITLISRQLTLNVNLQPKLTELKEVTVTERRKINRSQKELELDYFDNPDLIRTQFGIIDKNAVGHVMYILTENEFNSNAPDLATAIAGRFPNRGPSNSIYNSSAKPEDSGPKAIYDIDGMVFTDPPPISPANIERIAYIPSLSGAVVYGSAGSSGVIVINTKVGTFSNNNNRKNFHYAPSKNIYSNDALEEKEATKYLPSNLKLLLGSENIGTAKRIYENEISSLNVDPYSKIEALKIIHSKWGTSTLADDIIKDCRSSSKGDEIYSISLAYVLEELGEYEQAEVLYKEYFIKNPNTHKAYMNLYTLYKKMGNKRRAKQLLIRYFNLLESGFLSDQSNSILDFFRREAEILNPKNEFNNEDGLYIVVEWINPTTEFDLQFVNPSKEIFIWNNQSSEIENDSKILMDDFYLDSSNLGKWQINAKYLGGIKDQVTYVKLTFHFSKNSKQPEKQIQIKTIRFGDNKLNTRFFSFNAHSFL